MPNRRVGHSLDPSWSTPQNPVPDPGAGNAIVKFHELKGVVKRERMELKEMEKEQAQVPSLAELTLPRSEIRRLTTIGIRMKQKMKLGKAGITEGVVNGIHERWRNFEVVKIVCDDICRLNMKRTHDLLERKTGGMVVWRAGSKIVLYRGVNYKYPYFSLDEASSSRSSQKPMSSDDGITESAGKSVPTIPCQSSLIHGVGSPERVRLQLSGEKQLVEEADELLDGLGPRFTDWWGCDPLPVDADLLPAVVPGYRRPFRLLPYGVKPKLTNDEMTILKRLGRPLPCHFALGRNRNLQGLAAAVLKLWEKCEIAKIAVKRGVQNTNSQLMAEELKRLTGGTLLSRDKEYIVFYRGKDFLPSAVSSAIEERRKSRMQRDLQLINGSSTMSAEDSISNSEGHASANENEIGKVQEMSSQEQEIRSIEAAITRTNRKLSRALEEKERTEKVLSELEQAEISRQAEVDKEGITEEEKYMLRRVGLRMKPFLLLGRRGVFDGTIENMHLHWKYRELVKIICGGWNIDEIQSVARTLEAESGGILVAVERVRKGHAIIVYRGKNYQRPASLRPQTLLNKKEALKRSIEAQRRESLKLSVLKLGRNIEELTLKLVEDKEALDTRASEWMKSQLGPEKHELNPTVSDDRTNPQDDSLSCVQKEKLINIPSSQLKTHEIADNYSPSSDTMKDRTDTGISHCGDDREASCAKMSSFSSSDSDNASGSKSLFDSTCNESEPMISSLSDDSSEDGTSENDIMKHANKSDNKRSVPSLCKAAENNSHTAPGRARPLTNKERLLLRKQALKMRRRPVLAVGRTNVVTGVAKAIRDHFKKHPLAIVNVKGRAKGTSVQEVVFQLEQATGSVLVSQEPSKIILYRGWGGGVETGRVDGDKGIDKEAGVPSLAVSPELVAAMRLECGL